MRDWIRLRDVPLSTECDETSSGDDLHPGADTEPTTDLYPQTATKVDHDG